MESAATSQTSIRSQESSTGPLPAYDVFLRALGDSYLNFFSERLKLEEQYRDGMIRLLQRQITIDLMFNERLPDSEWTLRRAWKDVLEGLERESDVRGAFINSLRTDIVGPLLELKETHERSRKRIKEDVKNSLVQYNEYSENTLPRLRRTYMKRCMEADEWKHEGSARNTVTSPTTPHQPVPKPTSSTPSTPPTNNRSVYQSDAPSERGPRGRQSSIGGQGRRDRSPGGSTSFSDLAQQGRRQLNNLRTLIETKGGVGGNPKGEIALRGVRARRDADEADKEYRKGVHAMETLRLRREKILEAGYTSLETLVAETADLMVRVIERYSDNLTATNVTNSQLSTSLGSVVNIIHPIQDLQRLRQLTSKTLAAAIPKPILYCNYQVGECTDMLFGVSLVDYASSRGLRDNELPKIVSICTAEVEARGIKTEGIYRVPGRHAHVMELSLMAEKSEADFTVDKEDIHSIAALLKYYLRELPEPVFKFPIVDRVQYTEDRDKHFANNFAMIRSKIRRLPAIHQATLRAMLEHLSKVVANQKFNKMDAKNLAVIFGPVILGEEALPAGVDILTMTKDTLMEDMIANARILCDPHAGEERSSSPPLPSIPPSEIGALNSRASAPIYGSSHTVVKTLPSSTKTNLLLGTTADGVPFGESLSASSQYPPKLPPRPANRQPTRRNTISSGSVDPAALAGIAAINSNTAASRPSEDGRATGYERDRPSTGGRGPKLDTKGHSSNPSVSSTASTQRGKISASSSPARSTVPGRVGVSSVSLHTSSASGTGTSGGPSNGTNGTSANGNSGGTYLNASTTSTTGHESGGVPKKGSYSDSLLAEPAVLMYQAQADEEEVQPITPVPAPVLRKGNGGNPGPGPTPVTPPLPPATSTAPRFPSSSTSPPTSPSTQTPTRQRAQEREKAQEKETEREQDPPGPFSAYAANVGVGHGNVYGGDAGEVEVDYPGSPDTSALEFRTAENTPIHSPKEELASFTK